MENFPIKAVVISSGIGAITGAALLAGTLLFRTIHFLIGWGCALLFVFGLVFAIERFREWHRGPSTS